jgi:hypothetical protein
VNERLNTITENRPLYIYDTKINPLSFDIVFWLAANKLSSIELGETTSNFDVALCTDGFRDVGVESEPSFEYRHIKAYSVLIKLISICNWVKNIQICRDGLPLIKRSVRYFPSSWTPYMSHSGLTKPQYMFTPQTPLQIEQLFSRLSEGQKLIFNNQEGFNASKEEVTRLTEIYGEFILLHPRQSHFNPLRNTPIEVFSGVAEKLEKKGYRVICIPDVDDLDINSDWRRNFDCAEWASADPRLRLALSLAARHNILWSCGSVTPLFFSKAAFTVFGVLNSKLTISSPSFFVRKGPVQNRNPSWYRQNQHMNWVDARYVSDSLILQEIQGLL